MGELILNRAYCVRVLMEAGSSARRFLWIAAADLKDLHVEGQRGSFVAFVGTLAGAGIGSKSGHRRNFETGADWKFG
ncbi:MAG: hypothetical protein VCA55_05390 [Verrucomicrobiales bacterium]